MAEVTVIVPVYGVEKYLDRCVNSILKQTNSDLRLVLVDDGSLDQSAMMCDEYALSDARVSLIHKKNGGVSSARNAALRICESTYVTFCDSDDYWAPEWLEDLCNRITTTNADVVIADFQRVTSEGVLIRTSNFEKGSYLILNESDRMNFIIHQILEAKLGWEVCTRLFKTRIITTHNIQFCETCENYAEDLCFTLEYSLYCERIETCDSKGYYYVQHQESMIANSMNLMKYNAVNEVSKQFGKRFFSYTDIATAQKIFPVIHYLIFEPEYYKIFVEGKATLHPVDLKVITDYTWYRYWIKRVFTSIDVFNNYLGRKTTRYALRNTLLSLCNLWDVYKIYGKGKEIIIGGIRNRLPNMR